MRNRRRAAALALGAVVLFGACGGSSEESKPSVSTTPSFRGDPPLPPSLNTLPFSVGELVALRDLQVRVARVDGVVAGKAGASGTRTIDLAVDVRNGSTNPLTVIPESFRLYDLDGESVTPRFAGAPSAIASGRIVRLDLEYEVPAAETVPVLVVDGRVYTDASVSNALIALDPNWKPPPGDF